MATIEELEEQAAEVARAEGAAIGALVEGLRGLAVELPDGSMLARTFAVHARELEKWASPHSAYPWGASAVFTMTRRITKEQLAKWGEGAES